MLRFACDTDQSVRKPHLRTCARAYLYDTNRTARQPYRQTTPTPDIVQLEHLPTRALGSARGLDHTARYAVARLILLPTDPSRAWSHSYLLYPTASVSTHPHVRLVTLLARQALLHLADRQQIVPLHDFA